MRHLILATYFGVILFHTSTCIAGDFPYREKYPEINIIELADLKSGYDKGEFMIIDVRSITEFNVIHIKEAINLPYADARFTQKLRSITRKNLNKKVAVYDNGIDCIKSYKAAEDALYGMITNVYAFDAGIVAWANTYPSNTLLLGRKLKNPAQQLISPKLLLQKSLDFTSFKEQALRSDAVVIDVRDPMQRKKELPGLEKSLKVTVDKLVNNIVSKGRMKDKQLFIFDQVGRQVDWLMYHLVDKGYTNFYFLEGGATSVLKEQDYRKVAVR